MTNRTGKLTLLLVLGIAVLLPVAYSQEEKTKPEAYSAVAIGTGGSVGGKSIQFDFRITRYTSDEELDKYAEVLKEKGPDALRRTLEKVDVGLALLHASRRGWGCCVSPAWACPRCTTTSAR